MDTRKKRIAILGSTGSIGTQTLDVISQHRDLFQATILTANSNVELLAAQAIEFKASDAVICNEDKYLQLKNLLSGTGIRAHAGMDAVCALVGESATSEEGGPGALVAGSQADAPVAGSSAGADIVVTAMVGFSGVRSTVAAAKAGKTIALANKETLVAAGSVVTDLVRKHGASLIPVDSEHSAIFQAIQGNKGQHISKIHLTASGGPFRTWSKEKIAAALATDALKHPNWNMGAKVTIDSATMMNKGLEVIEAKWLFDVEPERINVLVHPQSIVHSMVEYDDGCVIAQLGAPDMREPIQYALSYPDRLALNSHKLDFAALGKLEFFQPDLDRFPCLGIAFEALRCGGTAAAVMNAANEIAVKAYLEGKIGFYGVADTILKTMDGMKIVENPSLEDIFAANDQAREYASGLIKTSGLIKM